MIGIIDDGVIPFVSDERFKELKELLAVAFPPILLSQPDFMKLNNVVSLSPE